MWKVNCILSDVSFEMFLCFCFIQVADFRQTWEKNTKSENSTKKNSQIWNFYPPSFIVPLEFLTM